MKQDSLHGSVLLGLIAVLTLVVGIMIQDFAMVLFLASLTAALIQPLYQKLCKVTRNRRSLSASLTLTAVILTVLIPLAVVTGLFVGQAVAISGKVGPMINTIMNSSTTFESLAVRIPQGDIILQYKDEIIANGGKMISSLSMFFVNKISSFTYSGIQFLFLLFLYLYSLFFLIRDGDSLLTYVLHRIPLPQSQKDRLLGRFLAVTRATVKGTLLIGVIQGVLAGVAMALAGIESALFWSIIMMILSVIPVLGTILVWLPASIVLILTGSTVPGVLLLLWCGIVVGNIDNILRPKLVGQDTGLHELLILFSTLGGLTLFGVAGFLVGPIVAALWVTLWDIYGELFSNYLSRPKAESTVSLPPIPPAPIRSGRPVRSRQSESGAESTGAGQHWLSKEYRRSKSRKRGEA